MKTTTKSISEKITSIVEKWFILEPLYFLIWTTHEAVPNPAITTLRTGNGYVEYNPIFLQSLSTQSLEEVLKAEVLRILLKHPYTRKKEQAEAAYLASNITIKEHSALKLPFPTAKAIFQTPKYDKKHFEWYYEKLLQQDSVTDKATWSKSTNKQQEVTAAPTNDATATSSKEEVSNKNAPTTNPLNTTKESTSTPSKKLSPEKESNLPTYSHAATVSQENTALWGENEWINSQINDKIETAIQSQSWGTIPNTLQELILAAMRPKVDYRKILRAFRQSVLTSSRSLTRMKPSRRYGFQYMGSRRDFDTKMLFALDTSGSVSSKDLQKGLAVLNQFFRYGIASIDVVFFDTTIKSKALTLKKAQKSLQITGRGGTNFQPIFHYINDHKGYDGLVIFTDGEAAIPERVGRPLTKVFWLFLSEGDYVANYGGLRGLGKGGFLK